EVSRRAHGSGTLVVAGHADCAGNPVSDDEHRAQLRRAVARLAERLPGTRILAVHTGQCGERCWSPELVEEVAPSGAAS
ncbi:MAG TPA: carbonic anhydrase, partial [Micromonosporaceae bacterium]